MCILSAARVPCRKPFVQIRERHHESCVPCVQAIAEDKDYAEWCVWFVPLCAGFQAASARACTWHYSELQPQYPVPDLGPKSDLILWMPAFPTFAAPSLPRLMMTMSLTLAVTEG